MSVTRYLVNSGGSCATRVLSAATGSITETVSVGILRTWDTEDLSGLAINSGTWSVPLWMLLASPGPGSEDVDVTVIRKNSSCILQEIIFQDTVTVTADTPTLYTASSSEGSHSFNVGDRLEVQVRHSTQEASVLLSFNSLARNSRIVFPDTSLGGTTLASVINAVSTFDAVKLEDDLLRASLSASSALSSSVYVEAMGEVAFSGLSQFLSSIETGAFIEALIAGVSTYSGLLDSILIPFPNVIPVSLDGRSRWVQFKFSGTGNFDVTIPGFMLYARTEGQDNVDEP